MSDLKKTYNDLKKLKQLMALRTIRCERALREARSEFDMHETTRLERLERINSLQSALAKSQSSGSTAKRSHPFLASRLYWLEYDLEKEEFYAQMDIDDCAQAKEKCQEYVQHLQRIKEKTALIQSRMIKTQGFLARKYSLDEPEVHQAPMELLEVIG